MMECLNSLTRGGMGSMMFMGIFWIILVIIVVYLFIKLVSDKGNRTVEKETPLEVLQKEFAKGNLTEEEYLKRKKHLE